MATKTDAQLDGMVFHIRYEVARLIDFLGIGNQWVARIEGLPDAVGTFAAESMLEAALVHARCVAEFLRHSGEPEDTITARDYIPDWHWIKGEGLKDDLAEIHGRVTHLGLIRLSVQHEGTDFRWDEFLTGTAIPTLYRNRSRHRPTGEARLPARLQGGVPRRPGTERALPPARVL
jgi:hypothetical protein